MFFILTWYLELNERWICCMKSNRFKHQLCFWLTLFSCSEEVLSALHGNLSPSLRLYETWWVWRLISRIKAAAGSWWWWWWWQLSFRNLSEAADFLLQLKWKLSRYLRRTFLVTLLYNLQLPAFFLFCLNVMRDSTSCSLLPRLLCKPKPKPLGVKPQPDDTQRVLFWFTMLHIVEPEADCGLGFVDMLPYLLKGKIK